MITYSKRRGLAVDLARIECVEDVLMGESAAKKPKKKERKKTKETKKTD